MRCSSFSFSIYIYIFHLFVWSHSFSSPLYITEIANFFKPSKAVLFASWPLPLLHWHRPAISALTYKHSGQPGFVTLQEAGSRLQHTPKASQPFTLGTRIWYHSQQIRGKLGLG